MRLRERYQFSGPAALSDGDVLACVLGAPAGQGRAVAARLLAQFGSLRALARSEPQELLEVLGVGPERAVRVHAALELGRRAQRLPEGRGPNPVRHPDDARAWLVPGLQGLGHEELHGLFLDRRRRVLARRRLTVGSDSFTVVDPRQVFRVALGVGAQAVVLAHNHPSGDPEPSRLDRQVTDRVVEAGRVLGIVLVDHLVVGATETRSFAESGWLSPDPTGLPWAAVGSSGQSSTRW
ncbi:MAG: DNA repair protein RadC [Myxococcota bacterium]